MKVRCARRPSASGSARWANSPAERIAWAVERLAPSGDDRVLELGPGHGVAVDLIAERLGPGGRVHAVDRSEKMIAAARRRNERHVEAGIATFETAAIAAAALEPRCFDRALGIHVGVFLRGDPGRELAAVARALTADGELCLCWEPFAREEAPATGDRQAAILEAHGFEVTAIELGELESGTSVCVRSRPA